MVGLTGGFQRQARTRCSSSNLFRFAGFPRLGTLLSFKVQEAVSLGRLTHISTAHETLIVFPARGKEALTEFKQQHVPKKELPAVFFGRVRA